jgi:hypothetical protein
MLMRSLIIFALGILCVLVAMVAIMGHWFIAAIVLGVGVIAVLLWAVIGGTGSKKVTDTDRTDEDPERARTYQHMMRNKAQPPGGGM